MPEGGYYSPVNNVRGDIIHQGGHYSPVNNVGGDNIHGGDIANSFQQRHFEALAGDHKVKGHKADASMIDGGAGARGSCMIYDIG